MKILITAIAFQDPYYDPAKGRVDYGRGQMDQMAIIRDAEGERARAIREGRPVDSRLRYGPLISGLLGMMRGRPLQTPEEEHGMWSEWTPDEVKIIFQDDSTPERIGPIKERLDMTVALLENSKIKATPLPLALSVHDHVHCWNWLSKNLLPMWDVPSPPDVRILVGNGTNPVRLALFHLGIATRQKGSQIWLSVDQELAGRHLPPVRPLVHGEGFLPQLALQSELVEKDVEILRLKQKIAEVSHSGGGGQESLIFDEDAKRTVAQSLLDELLGDGTAPIWKPNGDLHRSLLNDRLSQVLSERGIQVSSQTLRAWFSAGSKASAQRGKLYLLLPKEPRRP